MVLLEHDVGTGDPVFAGRSDGCHPVFCAKLIVQNTIRLDSLHTPDMIGLNKFNGTAISLCRDLQINRRL